MHRFFADERGIVQDAAYLNAEDAGHALRVLRLESGDEVELVCAPARYRAKIDSTEGGEVRLRVIEQLRDTEAKTRVTLYQGLPKADKMELIVQKSTELGAAAIAANSFAVTAESLCYMPGYGVGSAATTLVGRSVGAGDAAQARRYGNICTALGGALMGCTGLLMMIFCPFVFRLLTPVAEVRTLAAQVLRIGLLAEPLFGVSIAAAGALRGAGDTLVPSLLNLGSIWIVRLGLSLLLVGKLGLRGMWIAMAIELCVRGTLMLWRQLTSKDYETQSRLHGG